jgi:hypothetical protein
LTNKIVSTKTTSAIFLATVLILGTIAALSSSTSFMTIGANAQDQLYYGMDSRYNSYEPEYPDKKYDSYGYSDYAMDKDRISYDNSYESQYQSYKPDYKTQYPSYGKDDSRDKSTKDSSKSVSLNKIKCINTNLNINGNNTGDVNIGNKGQRYLGANSYGGYYDGYDNKKGKGFDCIINDNNNNINVAGGGNITDGNGNETDPCEECFLDNLSLELEIALAEELAANFTQFGTIKGLCEHLADETISPLSKADTLNFILLRIGVPMDIRVDIVDCLIELGFDIFRS